MVTLHMLFVGALTTLQSVPLDTVFTVGSEYGSDAVTFGRVADVALGPDGSVLVLDASDARIRAFDSSGQPVGIFGRVGDGPGEFRRPYAIDWLDSTVAVTHTGAVSEFTLDGRFVDSRRLPGYGIVHAIPLGREHTVILREGTVTRSSARPEQQAIIVVDDQLQVIDSGASRGVFVRHPNGSLVLDSGMCGTLSMAYAGVGRFLLADGEEGSVHFFEAAGIVRTFPVAGRAQPLSESRKAQISDLISRSSAGRYRSAEVTLPPYESTLCDVEVESTERAWVRMTVDRPGEVWRVLDLTTGELGRTIDIPDGLDVLAFRDGRMAAAWEDAPGVPYVSVFLVPLP